MAALLRLRLQDAVDIETGLARGSLLTSEFPITRLPFSTAGGWDGGA
jgi:hypothetical protein